MGRAHISRIAIKKMMRLKKMNYEEYRKAKALIESYEEIIKYLEYIKNVALNAKGLHPTSPHNFESLDEDEMDLDF
jgi:ABC-type phosphate/phosphonate transport system ATPase subunit